MFKDFKKAIDQQLKNMSKDELFTVNVDKDELWNLYLDSFPEGTNEIFRERREYDCSCCRNFVKNIGNVVSIIDGKITTIWDITTGIEKYDIVCKVLSEKIASCEVSGIYRSKFKKVGTDYNMEDINNEPKKWEHFFHVLDDKFVLPYNQSVGDFNGDRKADRDVLKRGLTEITLESLEQVEELINQNSIYRGSEHLQSVKGFITLKKEHQAIENKELYYWTKSAELKQLSRFRNSVIGTLVVDISNGVDLEDAVKMFETKVAPQNYKRSSALITASMIKKAEEKVSKLGISESLNRRYAVTEDITVNNVIYADREAKSVMSGSVFDDLKSDVSEKVPNLDRVQEVTIDKFIKDVVPTATTIELMPENGHINNLVSLIAPVNAESPNILKWNNNFSWSYNGEVTDSMKETVKKFGGKVDGVLRFSIQWNDKGQNKNDLDAHCMSPNEHIYYQNKAGKLDVDIINPGNNVAVENIIYTRKSNMFEGDYKFFVNNYSGTSGRDFTAEIEFDGKIYEFEYKGKFRSGQNIDVAVVNYSKSKGFTITEKLPSTKSSKDIWSIKTVKWQKVSMIMNSPNHWDGNKTGNKHYFFMLDSCKNPDKSRGLYNEFLLNDLMEHRKVFEVLGSKLKAEESENQLSGLGFSSTISNSVLCKVTGKTNRIIKIKF